MYPCTYNIKLINNNYFSQHSVSKLITDRETHADLPKLSRHKPELINEYMKIIMFEMFMLPMCPCASEHYSTVIIPN